MTEPHLPLSPGQRFRWEHLGETLIVTVTDVDQWDENDGVPRIGVRSDPDPVLGTAALDWCPVKADFERDAVPLDNITTDPDKPCYHVNFAALVTVARVGEQDEHNPTPGMPTAFVAELSVVCADCGEPFRFDGVPAGMSYDAPATSVDGRELRAPIRPVSAPPRSLTRRAGDVSGFRITPHDPDLPAT